jgi:hypothetical protein
LPLPLLVVLVVVLVLVLVLLVLPLLVGEDDNPLGSKPHVSLKYARIPSSCTSSFCGKQRSAWVTKTATHLEVGHIPLPLPSLPPPPLPPLLPPPLPPPPPLDMRIYAPSAAADFFRATLT